MHQWAMKEGGWNVEGILGTRTEITLRAAE